MSELNQAFDEAARVNNSLDQMGMYTSIQSAFALHHVGHNHNHNARVRGRLVDPAGARVIRDEA